MAAMNLRRYDVQATCAFVLSIVAIAPFAVAFALAATRFDPVLAQIRYGSEGKFVGAFAACVLTSMAPSALAFVLGWSSAGQRRNDRQARSWTGFFVGGLILTLNFILLLAFYKLRLEIPMGHAG